MQGVQALNTIYQECKKIVRVRENVRIRLSHGISSPVVIDVKQDLETSVIHKLIHIKERLSCETAVYFCVVDSLEESECR